MNLLLTPTVGYRRIVAGAITVLLCAFSTVGCDNGSTQTRDSGGNDDTTVTVDTNKARSADDTGVATTPTPPSSSSGTTTTSNSSGAGSTTTTATTISIRLPANTSKFLPGPDMPLADATPCLSCHSQGEANEFLAMRSPNYEVTKEMCTECHTADYVSSQPPGLGKPGWQKVVSKMVTRFDPNAINSTLNPHHQALMVDYLSATYDQ